jgi:hypothetical protein
MDPDVQKIAQDINNDMAFVALYFFAPINSALFACVLCFNALSIDNPVACDVAKLNRTHYLKYPEKKCESK